MGFPGREANYGKYEGMTGVGNSKQQNKGIWGNTFRNSPEQTEQ